MVHKITNNTMDSSSRSMKSISRSNNKGGLKDFFKQQEVRQKQEQIKSFVRRPQETEGDTSDDNSIDLYDATKPERPCYTDRFNESNDSMDDSVASFMSRSMIHNESPTARQKRRNRLEQMRADRDLVAKLELANQALEEEVNKKAQNKPLNNFFSGTRRRAQAFLPSEHPSSPRSIATTTTTSKTFLKNLNKITIPLTDDSSRRTKMPQDKLHTSMPTILPGNRDVQEEEEQEGEIPEIPALQKKANDFDVGRERSKIRANAPRERRARPARTRSGPRPAIRRPRTVQHPPVIREIEW